MKYKNKNPAFTYILSSNNLVTYNGTDTSGPAGQAPRGNYYEVTHYDDFCIYIKNHYENFNSFLGSSSISYTNNEGIFLGRDDYGHLIYKFACLNYKEPAVSISFDCKIRIFPPPVHDHLLKGNNSRDIPSEQTLVIRHSILGKNEITTGFQNRNQLRCLALSHDFQKIYYTNGGTLITLDRKLKVLNSWKNQNNLIDQHIDTENPIDALSILGLFGKPSNEDIKIAYRKKLLQVHPDINRDDPHADEKTRQVINAFEVLTNNDYLIENYKCHYEIIQGFDIYYPAFEDEITSLFISDIKKGMYLGFYSGKVIILRDSGISEQVFSYNSSIRLIKEVYPYLFIVSDKIFIFQYETLINTIDNVDGFTRIIWSRNNISVIRGRNIQLYSLNGILLGEMEFKSYITNAFVFEENLKIYSSSKIFKFKIHPITKMIESSN